MSSTDRLATHHCESTSHGATQARDTNSRECAHYQLVPIEEIKNLSQVEPFINLRGRSFLKCYESTGRRR